ncbi:hypothetical protein [Nocardia sp. NPDC059239]|uniref:hypothetical protein n=1 Tax=unclassified Nocardia TaxID=2637762 RepID=UPI0036B3F1F1
MDEVQGAALLIEQTRALLDTPEGDDAALTALARLTTGGGADSGVAGRRADGEATGADPNRRVRIVADYVVALADRLPGLTEQLNWGQFRRVPG